MLHLYVACSRKRTFQSLQIQVLWIEFSLVTQGKQELKVLISLEDQNSHRVLAKIADKCAMPRVCSEHPSAVVLLGIWSDIRCRWYSLKKLDYISDNREIWCLSWGIRSLDRCSYVAGLEGAQIVLHPVSGPTNKLRIRTDEGFFSNFM